jgi:hypothetical protein
MVRGCSDIPGNPGARLKKGWQVHPIQAARSTTLAMPRELPGTGVQHPESIHIQELRHNSSQGLRKLVMTTEKQVFRVSLLQHTIKITNQKGSNGPPKMRTQAPHHRLPPCILPTTNREVKVKKGKILPHNQLSIPRLNISYHHRINTSQHRHCSAGLLT